MMTCSDTEQSSCQPGHRKTGERTAPALQNATASPTLSRPWSEQLLAAILLSENTQLSSALSEGWKTEPSLLGLQLGGGKVSRMKEWEGKQTAHSSGSCWQEKGFPGEGRENEGLHRKAKRKPHVVLFQKNTEVRLVLQLCKLVGTNRLCQKQEACCHPLCS